MNGQSRYTGNIVHTRHRRKTNIVNKHNTTQKTKKDEQNEPHQITEVNADAREG